MKNEHFIKVYCNQKLPKENEEYLTDRGECKFDQEFNCFLELGTFEVTQCKFWLKPIDIEQVKAQVWEEGFKAHSDKLFDVAQVSIGTVDNPYKQQ